MHEDNAPIKNRINIIQALHAKALGVVGFDARSFIIFLGSAAVGAGVVGLAVALLTTLCAKEYL